MSNDYNTIHLNGTSGGYQSDNLKRVTAVIVATRHKQLCTYVRIYKELENVDLRECVSAGFSENVGIQNIGNRPPVHFDDQDCQYIKRNRG